MLRQGLEDLTSAQCPFILECGTNSEADEAISTRKLSPGRSVNASGWVYISIRAGFLGFDVEFNDNNETSISPAHKLLRNALSTVSNKRLCLQLWN